MGAVGASPGAGIAAREPSMEAGKQACLVEGAADGIPLLPLHAEALGVGG